ncbi:hypothetical protein RJ639_013645 [Escallonia herrerae]|uniref:XS domain-containing protein n=1 Tax=Escallonia herrerae TaxID=1293975 RepID=A0AA89ANA9_9ASTE|nr:hypothetical protein RJ639_013645 [Escallonia herrerae]
MEAAAVVVMEAHDMGFGGKTEVCRGKPANQSIMVVKFKPTLSGLKEAERLRNFYDESKHGRAEFQHIESINNSNTEETPKKSADKMENVLFAYLGRAEDLDKIDIETRKRCLVKSKKEIVDIADAPLKTELDAIGKDEEEEEHPTNMSNYYWYKEVVVITQVLFKEHIHWHFGSFRCYEACLDVAHLRTKYAIDCPGNWRTPVVPPPPYGDKLQEF